MSPLDKYSTKERIQVERLIKLYLKYGSLDKVFLSEGENLAFSYPNAHKILDEWGVIKSVGRQKSSIAETIYFFESLILKRISITKLVRIMPKSFHSSVTTMYRIYKNIMSGITRSEATALLMVKDNQILIGEDNSILGFKGKGQITIPVTYSLPDENPKTSILRTLQQEVFSESVLDRYNLSDLITKDPKPHLVIDIADIRCKVYVINLDVCENKIPKFTSYKLKNLRLLSMKEFYLQKEKLGWRSGTREIVDYYFNNSKTHIALRYIKADLNLSLPS